MKKYFNLLNEVAQEYNIPRGNKEDELSWKSRIVYSLLAQTGFASLFDIQDDLEPASIVHFKSKIMNTLGSLLAMYPELRGNYNFENQALADEIYDVYLSTGHIYHEPNRITPCVRKVAYGKNLCFLRGVSLEEKKWISGIGAYYPTELRKKKPTDTCDFSNLFCLQENTLFQQWTLCIDGIHFLPFSSDINLEYLKTVPPYRNGYWVSTPDLSEDISISRTVIAGSRFYYLYKYSEKRMMISQLPEWLTEGSKYRDIAVACLASRGTLPPTRFHVDGDIVHLQIDYLYPPAELNVIKLYSWPELFNTFPSEFKRIMSLNVFEEVKDQFEKHGYQFKEE